LQIGIQETPRKALKPYATRQLDYTALVLYLIYLLLDELKSREENRIHDT